MERMRETINIPDIINRGARYICFKALLSAGYWVKGFPGRCTVNIAANIEKIGITEAVIPSIRPREHE